ncbi:MAG TPA: DNA adenine methylase [Terriglobales bacterium]|nr:DNA adenine methylase [Terriglobales bacterium]
MQKSIGFRYLGGKQKLAPIIIERLPKSGRKFIDLFAGRANIALCGMQQGLKFDEWVLNDIRQYKFLTALREFGDRIKVPRKCDVDFPALAQRAKAGDPEALLLEPFLTWNGAGFEAARASVNKNGGSQSPENYERRLRDAHALLNSHNVRITSVDWWDCLRHEAAGVGDVVAIDPPYINANLNAGYTPEDICPVELVDSLQRAKFTWALCEYEQPFYVQAFGEPAIKTDVQLRATDFSVTEGRERRVECIWLSEKAKPNVTVTVEPVPEDRTETYYQTLPLEALLGEIKKGMDALGFHRLQMQRELRLRLLPALLELKKRTYRKKPGFYETLKAMGFVPDTVRMWFYRSYPANRIIDEVKEKTEEPTDRGNGGALDRESLLAHADRMAQAVLDGEMTYAKHLATEYVRVRQEDRVL